MKTKIWKPEELYKARWHSPACIALQRGGQNRWWFPDALSCPHQNFASFFHCCTWFAVWLSPAPARVTPAPPPQRVGNKGRERGWSWWPSMGYEFLCLRSPLPFFSFLYGLYGFFPLSLCVELSVASQQGILATIYPLLHQPRVPSPFLLDPIQLMRRDFEAAVLPSKHFFFFYNSSLL